jgi:hypothetical protein
MAMRTNVVLSLGLMVLVGVALVGCGEEPVPARITYAEHVGPLLAARCVRCHGAGGTLNVDPGTSYSWSHPDPKDPSKDRTAPKLAMFNTEQAARAYIGGSLKAFLSSYPMPPPPAPRLTERETEILLKWNKVDDPSPLNPP